VRRFIGPRLALGPGTSRVSGLGRRFACSLDAAGQRARLSDWEQLLRRAAGREATDGGVRYSFPAADELETRIRDLAAAEQSCCSFLEFGVSRTGDQIEMTVTAPPAGQDTLRLMFST
jgi:hypothetical protein